MTGKDLKLLERITIIPDLLNGKPTIRGLRFTVNDIIELISSGLSKKEILKQHPILENEDIRAALLYNSIQSREEKVFIIPDHMKEGIEQVMRDIKNGDFITMEEFEKKYEKWLK